MNAIAERGPMAKGKGRGRPKNAAGEGSQVRVDADIASKARMVATQRGMSLAAYLSESLRPTVDRDFGKLVRKLADDEDAKGR